MKVENKVHLNYEFQEIFFTFCGRSGTKVLGIGVKEKFGLFL